MLQGLIICAAERVDLLYNKMQGAGATNPEDGTS